MKLLPSHGKFCVHHWTMHQFTVLIHSKPHGVYMYLTVTCHLHFWQNGQDLLHATAVDGGGTDSKVRVCTESAQGQENYPAGIQPRTFLSQVQCWNHWAVPTPQIAAAIQASLWKLPKTSVPRPQKAQYGGKRLWECATMNPGLSRFWTEKRKAAKRVLIFKIIFISFKIPYVENGGVKCHA